MEALLKLIVGVDGVTAAMLIQVAWAYAALKVGGMLTGLGVAGVIGRTIFCSVKYCQDSDIRREEAKSQRYKN